MKVLSKIGLGVGGAAVIASGLIVLSSIASAGSAQTDQTSAKEGSLTSVPNYRAQLETLSKTQTPAQAAAIEASGGPVEVLIDSSTGAVLAALKPTTEASPFEVTQ
jgi:hypothetical protein